MGTIEIHEPEVKEVKPPSRPRAAVLPKSELVEAKFTPRPMLADSVLDFGQQKKPQSFATVTSFILNCLAIGVMLIMPLAFPEGLPKAQAADIPRGPSPAASASATGRRGAAGGAPGSDRHAEHRPIGHAQPDSAAGSDDQGRRRSAADAVRGWRGWRCTRRPSGRTAGWRNRRHRQRNLERCHSEIRARDAAARAHLAGRNQGTVDSKSLAAVSAAGTSGPRARRRRSERRHRHQRADHQSATGQGTPDAGSGRNRRRETVALQTILAQRTAGRGGDHHHRDLLLIVLSEFFLGVAGV